MEEVKTVQGKTIEEEKGMFAVGALVGCVALLLFYFCGWSYIYNTEYGVEIGISGWNLIVAFLTDGYSSLRTGVGSISVPFYKYASSITVALSILAFVSFIFVLITTGLVIANLCLKNKRVISKIIHVMFYLLGAIFIASIVVALCMKHGRILRTYCSGNPACSMQTLIFFQAILSIGLGIVYSVFLYKYKD